MQPTAARKPRTVAIEADENAIITLLRNAIHKSAESKKSFLYQTSEKFVHKSDLSSLKDAIMTETNGKKRKIITTTSTILDAVHFFFAARFA